MLRASLVVIALPLLATAAFAAPAQRQPRPAEVAEAPRPAVDPDAMKKAQVEQEARDRKWDAAMKRTMGGVCRGC